MDAAAEGEMFVVFAADIESARIRKAPRIAISREDRDKNRLPGGYRRAGEGRILQRSTRVQRNRWGVAEVFLDCAWAQQRIADEAPVRPRRPVRPPSAGIPQRDG
jgi:hypothetical protein